MSTNNHTSPTNDTTEMTDNEIKSPTTALASEQEQSSGNVRQQPALPDDDIGNSIADSPSSAPNGNVAIQSSTEPTRSVAASSWYDADEEPDDDIGNRIDGPPHHERSAVLPDQLAPDGNRNPRHRRNGRPGSAGTKAKKGKNQAGARDRASFRIGDEVFGNVTKVLDDAIFIDLTGKGTAVFDRAEWTESSPPQPGDHFVAKVRGDGSRGGNVVLTFDMNRIEKGKNLAQKALETGEAVEALVTAVIKGGIELDLMGLRAFAPASHVVLKAGTPLEPLLGKRLPFKVMKYDKNGKEVVLSRREFLEKQAAEQRAQSLKKLQVGHVVSGVVRKVMDWGMFVAIPEADDIEGLVHVTEASHDRSRRLAQMFQPGDEVKVKVLKIDDKGKLWLSTKATTADPWDSAAETYAVGTRHRGRVARMQPFGAFIELAPGVDGLIRTNDISLKRVGHPQQAVQIDQEMDVVVVHLDAKKHKIGLHPALPEDADEKPQRIEVHRVVQVEVVSPEPAGLLVRILGATGADARGFIPAGHTGTSRGTDLSKAFPKGTKLEAKIIDRDHRRGETKLSIRALKYDSEKAAYREYRAKVARESKFGTFGDLFQKHRNK